MNRLFKVMPQHLNRIQVRTLTRPLQSLHFVFLQPFRGGFAGVFWIIVLLQNPSSLQLEVTNRWPDIVLQDFLVDSRIHGSIYHSKSSRSWSSKTAPDHHTTTTIFYCWYDVLFLKCCVGTLPCMPFLPSLFLMVESWTLTLTEASEACSSLDVVVGSFVTSWMSRPATPGKVHHCSMFSPFVDNGSHCGSLESQSFRNGFITFSRLIDLNYFLSLLFYFTLSGRSYLSDFLIANRCGNNQAWMWLEKLNSGVINHSYVLTGGGGQTLFHTGPCGFGFCFKKKPSFKNCMLCLLVLSLINI